MFLCWNNIFRHTQNVRAFWLTTKCELTIFYWIVYIYGHRTVMNTTVAQRRRCGIETATRKMWIILRRQKEKMQVVNNDDDAYGRESCRICLYALRAWRILLSSAPFQLIHRHFHGGMQAMAFIFPHWNSFFLRIGFQTEFLTIFWRRMSKIMGANNFECRIRWVWANESWVHILLFIVWLFLFYIYWY